MIMIDKSSPEGLEAIAGFILRFGFDPREVLNPEDWFTGLLDGRAEVCVHEGGMRTLATLAPDPKKAQAVADRLLAHMHGKGGK